MLHEKDTQSPALCASASAPNACTLRPHRIAAVLSTCLTSVALACTSAGNSPETHGSSGAAAGASSTSRSVTGGSIGSTVAATSSPAGGIGAGGTSSTTPVSAGSGGIGTAASTGGTRALEQGGSTSALASGGSTGLASGGRSLGGTSASSSGTQSQVTGFFTEDFESAATGQAPPGWDTFIAYNKNGPNPSGTTLALVDGTRFHGGSKSLHVHGGTSPALITRPLPVGTNKLYARVWVYMTRQLGNHPMSSNPNHETVLGIRAVTNAADDEVRFGEIKGVIGTNVPKLSDNISPPQPSWYSGPSVPADTWACIEVAFHGDTQPNTLQAWANGTLVHEITSASDWNAPGMPANWLNGEFTEFIMGWHSFSNNEIDAWFDDVVLSASPVGCD